MQNEFERYKEELAGTTSLHTGDVVSKVGGDYTFDGTVRAVFEKGSGATRYVVEDDRGILHIFSRQNLRLRP